MIIVVVVNRAAASDIKLATTSNVRVIKRKGSLMRIKNRVALRRGTVKEAAREDAKAKVKGKKRF